MTFGILALLFGLGGAYLARIYLQDDEIVTTPAPPVTTSVPLASLDLPADKTLVLGDIVLQPMTDSQMQDENIDRQRAMINPQQIVGRILRAPVRRGQPFYTDSLYPAGTRPGIASKLNPGFRAVTIPLDADSAVSGFAGPGSIVDVLFRTSSPYDRAGFELPDQTRTLLQGVEILALGPYTTPGEEITQDIDTVTLAVTPEQARTLAIVEGRGRISLSLRDPDENAVAIAGSREQGAGSLLELLDIRPPERQWWFTEIYTRGQGTVRQFPIEEAEEPEETFDGGPQPFSAPVVPPGRFRTPAE